MTETVKSGLVEGEVEREADSECCKVFQPEFYFLK